MKAVLGLAALIAPLCAASAGEATDPVVARMSLEQKVAQLQSSAPADPTIGLPAYDWWNEGLHGLARNGVATVFPQAIGLAASWDRNLLYRAGEIIATEARAKYNQRPHRADRTIYEGLTIWSPNINIFRDPRWGRGQETYGEDSFLTGTLATGFIRGLQGPDPAHPRVIATPKHLAVHSGPEAGRDGFDADPSPQDLEATYLPAFRKAIVEGQARSVMCAYNAIHGVPVCALPALMIERLRRDWGFTGLTVSDCDAVANIDLFHNYRTDPASAAAAALRGGTDLNCGTSYAALTQAVRRGLITTAEIDAALTRAFAARRALGIAFGADDRWSGIGPENVATPAHAEAAVEAARRSIVLLENDGHLPLSSGTRIAVIGPNADDLGVLQGNYHGTAAAPVTPLAGIRARFGAGNVRYAQGAVLAAGAPVIVPETAWRADGQPGLKGEYFAGPTVAGTPVALRQDRRIDFDYNRAAPLPQVQGRPFAVRWTGQFVPPGPGDYTLILDVPACWKDCTAHDAVRLWIDDRPVLAGPLKDGRGQITVSGGSTHAIRLEIDHVSADEGLRLLWLPPAAPLLAEAVAAAREADTVVAVVGLSPDLEGEALRVDVPGFTGGDRTDIALPGPQQALLAALKATGKPVVVVLVAGSAVALDPRLGNAVLALWYPGEGGGTALAETLAGIANPAGRLPVTFYRATRDLPAFVDYGMKERTYRYFTGSPLWPFGHGLSYTTFAYPAAQAPATVAAGASLGVSVVVGNAGKRDGDEVVQAYLVPPAAADPPRLTTPVLQRQLAAFARVPLKAGERRTVNLAIDPRSMSTVDRAGTRRVVPGVYRLWIGGGQPGDAPGLWRSFTVTGSPVELPK